MKEFEVYEITTHDLCHNNDRRYLVIEHTNEQCKIPELVFRGIHSADTGWEATGKAYKQQMDK